MSKRGFPVQEKHSSHTRMHTHHQHLESQVGDSRSGDINSMFCAHQMAPLRLCGIHSFFSRSFSCPIQDVRKPPLVASLSFKCPYYNRLGSQLMPSNSPHSNYHRGWSSGPSHDGNPRLQHSSPSFSNPTGGNLITHPRNHQWLKRERQLRTHHCGRASKL
jgi:hypothetical protein